MSFDHIWEFECWQGHLNAEFVITPLKSCDNDLTQILERYFAQFCDLWIVGERKKVPLCHCNPQTHTLPGMYREPTKTILEHLSITAFLTFPGFPSTLHSSNPAVLPLVLSPWFPLSCLMQVCVILPKAVSKQNFLRICDLANSVFPFQWFLKSSGTQKNEVGYADEKQESKPEGENSHI